jgi:hypothetical protein
MALPTNRPFREVALSESTTSIATSPVAMAFIAPCSGYIKRVLAGSGGTTTGTITVAVTVNGGSDVCSGGLTIAAGSGNNGSSVYTLPLSGSNAAYVNEGDYIVCTPSGGTGTTISGACSVVINALQ